MYISVHSAVQLINIMITIIYHKYSFICVLKMLLHCHVKKILH